MSTQKSLARTEEAERLLMQAIADVPLTATGPEIAAAVQCIGLKLAERCMEPRVIAHVLISQADAYLQAAGGPAPSCPPLDGETVTEAAHRILTDAWERLTRAGIPQGTIGHLILGYGAAAIRKSDTGPEAAEALYATADAIVARSTAH